jgi:hypothetical protein
MVTVLSIICISCDDLVTEKEETLFSKFQENPVTISWDGDKTQGIQSYQAKVEVYAMNNRRDSGATLRETYRIATKTIGDKIYTRLDFDGDETTAARTVISDGGEIVVFDPVTETVEMRILGETPASPLLKLFNQETGMSRINLSLIREEAERLALDMTEQNNGKLLIDLPESMFPGVENTTVTRRQVAFDTANDTLSEIKIEMITQDGTRETSTLTPVYQDIGGVPVKVGMVMIMESKAPELIEGFDPETPIYNSMEDLPVLSREDYEKLVDAGNVSDTPDMVFGNPADLSYTETVYEVYQNMEINNVSDQIFRLLRN